MLAVRSNERAAAAAGINVRNTKFAAYAISSFIAGRRRRRSTPTRWARSAPSASGSSSRSGFVAFAYVGGITMVSGAVFGGLIATSGVIPHIFEAELGISGTWTLLVAGVTLILNLILFPDGVAGSRYQKKQQKLAAAARPGATPAPGGQQLGDGGDGERVDDGGAEGRGRVGELRRRAGARRRRARGARGRPWSGSSAPTARARRPSSTRSPASCGSSGRVAAARPRALAAGAARARAQRPGADVAGDRALRRPDRGREPRGRLGVAVGVGRRCARSCGGRRRARPRRTRR